MKTSALLLAFSLLLLSVKAQNDIDMLRYAQTTFNGDARFMAMGGSFGALGANNSCINFNPAGIALYRKGELTISGGIRSASVNANHYGNSVSDFRTNLNIGNFGLVAAWEEKSPYSTASAKERYKDWSRRHAIGMSYNKIANFSQYISIDGQPNKKSMVEDFLNVSQGLSPDNLNPYYEGLAYNTYLIDTMGGATVYDTYFYLNNAFKQTKTIDVRGGVNELSFAYGYAMDNRFYFGAALGIPLAKWDYVATYKETDPSDSNAFFNSFELSEVIQTRGTGVNLKIGLIGRVSSNIRIGAYLHSPTRFALNDVYQNSMSTDLDTNGKYDASTQEGLFRYSINTPFKAGGSIGIIVNKFLALNADYEFLNYASGYLSSRPDVFGEVNKGIRNKYKSTANVRAGMEINIKPVVFRFGYAMYGSPFGEQFTGNFVSTSFSGGIGFRNNEHWFLDLAYVHTLRKEDYYLYDPKFVAASNLKFTTGNFVITYGVKFN